MYSHFPKTFGNTLEYFIAILSISLSLRFRTSIQYKIPYNDNLYLSDIPVLRLFPSLTTNPKSKIPPECFPLSFLPISKRL